MAEHRQIAIDDLSLSCETEGSGPPIVLLHGFAQDRRVWQAQVPALAARRTVVRYDLRGFGRSASPGTPYRHTSDLERLIDRLQFERVALMGLSLGGSVAISFALDHPGRVERLILAAPALSGFRWSAEIAAEQAAVRRIAQTAGVAAARDRWLALPTCTPALAHPAAGPLLREMVGAYSGQHWLTADPAMPSATPAIQRLTEIRAPTLIIGGDLDGADFRAIAAILARDIPLARYIVIAGAGHLVNLEASAAFNAAVLAFLAGAPVVVDPTAACPPAADLPAAPGRLASP